MSSIKEVNNIMSSQNSIFSHLKNESDSEIDEDIKNIEQNIEQNKKPIIKEEKTKYNIKKSYIQPSKENTQSSEWTSVETGKNKKFYNKTKYNNKTSNNKFISNNTHSLLSTTNNTTTNNTTTNNTTTNNTTTTLSTIDNKQEFEDTVDDNKVESDITKYNIEQEMKELNFQNKWYVWLHEIDSKDWSAKSYKIIHTIENLWDFWLFFNHTYLLNQWKYNFFIIKSTSHPTWEHSTNRNGGTCSIRIDIGQSIEIIEQLSILLVNESLTDEINDINGISFAAKGNWCVIKIWNRDYKNNISNQIPPYLRKIYPAISIKYKENIPEY